MYRLRQIKHYFVAGISTFVLAVLAFSCSDEDTAFSGSSVPVRFTSSVTSGAPTRVSDDSWDAGDKVGIFMFRVGNSIPDERLIASNYQYRAVSSGTTSALVAVGDPLYYPGDDSEVNFIAYHPYNESVAGYVYPVDVTKQNKETNVDLLYHKGTEPYSLSGPIADLQFSHQLSQIIIRVSRDAEIFYNPEGWHNLEEMEVVVSGTPTQAKFDLTTGVLTISDNSGPMSDDVTLVSIQATATSYLGQAILVPHSEDDYTSREVTFKVEDRAYKYSIPSGLNFGKGNSYLFDFVADSVAITLNPVRITDWEEAPRTTVVPPSNCYILKPGGHTAAIPVSRANEWVAQLGENEAFDAALLWCDNEPGTTLANLTTIEAVGTGYKGHIRVTSGKQEGNAVVALLNKSGKILWSWHIWVTGYDPDASAGNNKTWTTSNGFTWMDRNLGATTAELGKATSYGLIYQWGRKDAFPGASPVTGVERVKNSTIFYGINGHQYTTTERTGNIMDLTIAETFSTPLTFYIRNGVPFDWTNEYEINHRWGQTATTAVAMGKTIFDPCPAGWRVPYYIDGVSPWAPLSNYGSDSSTSPYWGGFASWRGYDWSSLSAHTPYGVYPDTGYRNSGGTLSHIGTVGYVWSASPYNSNSVGYAYAFGFASSTGTLNPLVIPDYGSYRTNGRSVRCVAEANATNIG